MTPAQFKRLLADVYGESFEEQVEMACDEKELEWNEATLEDREDYETAIARGWRAW